MSMWKKMLCTCFMFAAVFAAVAEDGAAVPDVAVAETTVPVAEAAEAAVQELPVQKKDYSRKTVDLSVSAVAGLAKVYTAQNIAYTWLAPNGLGVSGGIRVMENIFHSGEESYAYFIPYVDFRYRAFYIGTGVMLSSDLDHFYARLGMNFRPSQHLGFTVGMEMSPTFIDARDSDSKGGAAIAGAFASGLLSALNVFKIEAGFVWYFPLKDSK